MPLRRLSFALGRRWPSAGAVGPPPPDRRRLEGFGVRRRLEAADEGAGRRAGRGEPRAPARAADACCSLPPRTRVHILTRAPHARVRAQVRQRDRRGAAGQQSDRAGRPSDRAIERGRAKVEAEVEGRGGGGGWRRRRRRGGGGGGTEAEAKARRRRRRGRRAKWEGGWVGGWGWGWVGGTGGGRRRVGLGEGGGGGGGGARRARQGL